MSNSPTPIIILFAVLYSTLLNLRLPHHHTHHPLPSLPLRHSNLINLLPHLIFESIFIARLSHSSLASLGACLHLLKLPLLSTIHQYFNLGFQPDVCKSLAFDLINYLGQFFLFYVLSSSKQTQQRVQSVTGHNKRDERILDQAIDQQPNQVSIDQLKSRQKKKHWVLMSALVWILVSLVDAVSNFILEKTLSPKIQSDVQAYMNKLELDQYFLLKSSGTTPSPGAILRSIPPKDRSMLEHQLISPIINLPYFFSSASLISLPCDFILLDRLPMLSFSTKIHWLFGLASRRLLNSGLAYFLKN